MNIAYLAGLLDGEGYIGLEKGAKGSYSPRVQLVMCCETTINISKSYLESLGLSIYYYNKRKEKSEKHNQSLMIRISGCKDVLILSSLMVQHSITKRKQWQLIQAFCERRKPYSAYDDIDNKIYDELKLLNRRGKDD